MAILNEARRKDNVLHWSLLGSRRRIPIHKQKTHITSITEDQDLKHGDWKKRLLWKMKMANP
jgi:hypothetical protein